MDGYKIGGGEGPATVGTFPRPGGDALVGTLLAKDVTTSTNRRVLETPATHCAERDLLEQSIRVYLNKK